MELEEGSIVLCTVVKIIGTTVFVKLDDYGKEGTIITSEIAPGRIRNLRDYVVPNKKIVCKILRLDNQGHIDLSLRRVIAKEKREIIEAHEKEKSIISAIKTMVSNPDEAIQKIKSKGLITDFFEAVKTNPEKLREVMSEEEAQRLIKAINEKKEREVTVKKKFMLTNKSEDGIKKIKKILPKETIYIAAGKYFIEIKDKNYKEANRKIEEAIKDIEQKAKQEGCFFELIK